MRVKIFETCALVNMGDQVVGGSLANIENDINLWLEKNPEIKIVDIRFSYGGASVQDGPTNYRAMCLILYENNA